jgi:hypothetical protein
MHSKSLLLLLLSSSNIIPLFDINQKKKKNTKVMFNAMDLL